MTPFIAKINRTVDRWLTAPESNAAGRLGLFRIVYAVFYLWALTGYLPGYLANLPAHLLDEVLILQVIPNNLPVAFFEGLLAMLVAALVFLLFGYKTRWATAVVLVSGGLLESFLISSGFEHSTIFLMAYIPFFMLVGGDWGATWSVDALHRPRSGSSRVDPSDTSPRFVLPIHATLVVLAALFCSAGLWKLVPWTVGDNVFGYHFLDTNIKLAKLGLPMNPFAQWFLDYPVLDVSVRAFVVLFEGTFVLALINRKLRAAYLFAGLMFNAINGAFLGVTFTPMLIVYGLYVDWHALAVRIIPRAVRRVQLSASALAAGTVLLAAATAVLWTETRFVHQLLTAGGQIDHRTIWFPIVPVAIIGFAWSVWSLLRAGVNGIAAYWSGASFLLSRSDLSA
jgi:hypothetical protein